MNFAPNITATHNIVKTLRHFIEENIHMPEVSTVSPPLVTIITVTYNSSAHVRDTIDSLLDQTYTHLEYIFGDDSSTDNTWDIIDSYRDERIRAYRNETNLGEYANRNKALSMATGKYLIFIDGDDMIYPHAVTVFLSYAERFPQCSMFFCREWDHRILYPYKIAPTDIFRFEYLDRGIIGGSFTNVFFNTHILQQTTLPLNIATGDTYVQLKIAKKYPALIIPSGLTWWRRRTGNATEVFFSNPKNLAETTGYRLKLLQDDCPLNDEEIDLAKKNIYGGYMRLLVRLFVKGKVQDVLFLFRTLKVPRKYYKALFLRGKYNYFDQIKGDKPLHSN